MATGIVLDTLLVDLEVRPSRGLQVAPVAGVARWPFSAVRAYPGLRPKHLPFYLDEFAFRFNRRHTRHAAFHSLLGIGIRAKPITYKMLISPEATG